MHTHPASRRRGRVVGRVLAPLYDILDQVLGQSSRPGEGLSGKPVEVVLPFEEPELGASGGRRGGRGKHVYEREKRQTFRDVCYGELG